jgi:protein-glutamine gamma-glutamyltransferase
MKAAALSKPAAWRVLLAAWPRETRDTLFMLALIAWTIAPHLLRLSAWFGLLCVAVLGWRGRLALRQAPLPGRVALVAVLMLGVALTWRTQHTLLGKEAGVSLLVLLMALKTLELRARRDALVVFFLGFFLVLTNFLYSQSLPTALAMSLSVWGWLTALTLAHMPAGFPRLRDASALAARAALVGTPVMVALFLLFPRLAPLWSLPSDAARTGLSDRLRLGDIAELAQDDSIALRLKVMEGALAPQALYFRGPVLQRYDGQQWQAQPDPPLPAGKGQVMAPAAAPMTALLGPSVRYEMTLEPLRIAWLPLLDLTPTRPSVTPELSGLRASPDDSGQWTLRQPLAERVRLLGEAWPQAQRGLELTPTEQRALTQLPPGTHPRTRAWARVLQAQPELQGANASSLSAAVLRHIRSTQFRYTLTPGSTLGDSVDEFWLDRQAGFCEHYAASYVVVMRAMGVPARIVTGYQGGDAEPVDGYVVVRQSHAHAWAEYWQAGRGWLRADPTAAVAPERIDRGRALRPAPGVVAGAFDAMSPGLRLKLRAWFEGLDNRWNQWVLGYGQQQQLKLLQNLGLPSADVTALAQALGGLLAMAALAGALWAAWDARRQTPWQRLQQGIARELAQLGIGAAPHMGLDTLAHRVEQAFGPAGALVAGSLRQLEAQRYGPAGVSTARRGHGAWRTWRAEFSRHCQQLLQQRRRQRTAPR